MAVSEPVKHSNKQNWKIEKPELSKLSKITGYCRTSKKSQKALCSITLFQTDCKGIDTEGNWNLLKAEIIAKQKMSQCHLHSKPVPQTTKPEFSTEDGSRRNSPPFWHKFDYFGLLNYPG